MWLDNRFGPVANFTRLGSFVLCHLVNLNKSYGPSKLSVYYHALDRAQSSVLLDLFSAHPEKEFGYPVFIIVTCRLKKSYMQGENGKAISFLNEMLSENLYGEY